MSCQTSFVMVIHGLWSAVIDFMLKQSQGDLLIPDRWRSPTTFERVTFSPSQKRRKNCQVFFDVVGWKVMKSLGFRKYQKLSLPPDRVDWEECQKRVWTHQGPVPSRFLCYRHLGRAVSFWQNWSLAGKEHHESPIFSLSLQRERERERCA